MEIIRKIFYTIFMNDEGMIYLYKVNSKKKIFFFIFTNVLIPFVINIIYSILSHTICSNVIIDCIYFIFWNILLNIILFASLYLIFLIKKNNEPYLIVNAIVFMNLIHPVAVLLGLIASNIIISVFFIIYYIVFVIKFLNVNSIQNTKKNNIIYTIIAFFIVFCFLSITGNVYMII